MATIDLGRIKFKWQGAWSSSTSYVVDDVVESGGNTYVCIAASTNNVPPNATYWELMAQKGTDTSVATTQGDIIYHNGTSLARLGAGTSGQYLETQGSGANPQWSTVEANFVKATQVTWNTRTTTSSQSGDQTILSNFGTIVKDNDSSTSDLYFHIAIPTRSQSNDNSHYDFKLNKSGGSTYTNSTGLLYASNGSSFSTIHSGSFKFTGLPAGTYSITIVLSSNGNANNGGHVYNPNSSDQNRLNQTQSHFVCYEIKS